jgi:hypothetical protein
MGFIVITLGNIVSNFIDVSRNRSRIRAIGFAI